DKHNTLVTFVGSHSSELELHRRGLLSLRGKMCNCHPQSSSPLDGEGEALTFSDSPTPPCDLTPSPPQLEASSLTPVVAPVENIVPIPVPPLSQGPRCTVVESCTTLRAISETEAWEIKDRIVGAWQRQGTDSTIPITLDGLGSSKRSAPSCATPVMELTQDQQQILNQEARGYRMLSVMRAVTMMPNLTVSAHLLSSDHIGGELQLVFPISQDVTIQTRRVQIVTCDELRMTYGFTRVWAQGFALSPA
ncbi:hypothetical protein BDM02DRAFT_3127624, partial [Thelephora ganbajun]